MKTNSTIQKILKSQPISIIYPPHAWEMEGGMSLQGSELGREGEGVWQEVKGLVEEVARGHSY